MTKREQQRCSNTRNRKTSPAARLKFYVLIGIAVVIVCTGFFVAAGQHFWSMDYGIKNSRLRKQLDDLETEKAADAAIVTRSFGVARTGQAGGQTAWHHRPEREAPQLASLVKTSPNSGSATASIRNRSRPSRSIPL